MVSFRSTGATGGQVASEDIWPKGLDCGDCRGLKSLEVLQLAAKPEVMVRWAPPHDA